MPSNTANPSTYSPEDFGLALKKVRERKQITLDHIADVTKIPTSVFAALERGDLRHWPKGLFGRSFFRAYAESIGVPVDKACAEFMRVFGEILSTEPPEPEPPPESRAAGLTSWLRSVLAAWSKAPSNGPAQPEWISDARRVGPAPPAKLRVRIKLPR